MEISLYTADRWGVDQAVTYASQINAAIEKLARSPLRGVDCSELHRELRGVTSGSHHIYYLFDESLIDVVRILHPAMDVEQAISDMS